MSDEEGSPRALGSDREDEPMKADSGGRDDARSPSRERSASPARDKSRSRSPMRSRSRSPVASPVRSPVVRRDLLFCADIRLSLHESICKAARGCLQRERSRSLSKSRSPIRSRSRSRSRERSRSRSRQVQHLPPLSFLHDLTFIQERRHLCRARISRSRSRDRNVRRRSRSRSRDRFADRDRGRYDDRDRFRRRQVLYLANPCSCFKFQFITFSVSDALFVEQIYAVCAGLPPVRGIQHQDTDPLYVLDGQLPPLACIYLLLDSTSSSMKE